MANTTKVTKKDNFNEIIKIATELNRPDLVDFCKHEIELLNKKASKETKNQKENAELMEKLLNDLVIIGKPVTITDFMKLSDTVKSQELSNQKVSAMFSKMKDATVERTVVKGKAFFSAM